MNAIQWVHVGKFKSAEFIKIAVKRKCRYSVNQMQLKFNNEEKIQCR